MLFGAGVVAVVGQPHRSPNGACWNFHRQSQYYVDRGLTENPGCFDVYECAAKAKAVRTAEPKRALVLSHSLEDRPPARFRPEMFWGFTQYQKVGIDTVLLVPGGGYEEVDGGDLLSSGSRCPPPLIPEIVMGLKFCRDKGNHVVTPRAGHSQGIFLLTDNERAFLKKHNVKIVEAPWSVPPGLFACDGCASTDLLRLHAMHLTEYDAIAYFDFDVTLQGDVVPLLDCAATGEILMTEGAVSPLNIGMMAWKPSDELFKMALYFAEKAEFHRDQELLSLYQGAWGDSGTAPSRSAFPGMGCGQGFLWALLYGNGLGFGAKAYSHVAQEAAAKYMPIRKDARLIDRCIWNYQREPPSPSERQCKKDFQCKDVIAMHKAYEEEHKHPESDVVCWRHHAKIELDSPAPNSP